MSGAPDIGRPDARKGSESLFHHVSDDDLVESERAWSYEVVHLWEEDALEPWPRCEFCGQYVAGHDDFLCESHRSFFGGHDVDAGRTL